MQRTRQLSPLFLSCLLIALSWYCPICCRSQSCLRRTNPSPYSLPTAASEYFPCFCLCPRLLLAIETELRSQKLVYLLVLHFNWYDLTLNICNLVECLLGWIHWQTWPIVVHFLPQAVSGLTWETMKEHLPRLSCLMVVLLQGILALEGGASLVW